MLINAKQELTKLKTQIVEEPEKLPEVNIENIPYSDVASI
jgi:hypothetical protein